MSFIVFNYNQISLVSLVLSLTFIIIALVIIIILIIEFILLVITILVIIVSIIIFITDHDYHTALPRQPPRQEVAPGATER